MNYYSDIPSNTISFTPYSTSVTVHENFDSRGFSSTTSVDKNTIISTQATPLLLISEDYSAKLNTVNQNYIDLSNNVGIYGNIRSSISGKTSYDYDVPFNMNKQKTLLDGLVYDNNLMVVQENAMYVLATITAATLIVFAIILGREK
jgi:hypothetical protein